MRNGRSVAVLVSAVVLCACGKSDNLHKPLMFFQKEQIGSSADYGIFKWGNPGDHIATVHGFIDDAASCQIMADGLNRDACAETGGRDCLNPFSCLPLKP